MVSQEKWMILTPLQKLPKNGEDWGKLIVAKGFKKLPKAQNIAQSGHTGNRPNFEKIGNPLARCSWLEDYINGPLLFATDHRLLP